MIITNFPQNIFLSQRKFSALTNDMLYGDMSAEMLKRDFGLTNISNIVDPYTLTKKTAFNNPQSRFAGVYGNGNSSSISVAECARLLFGEMQVTSLPFAMVGSNKSLINDMLLHMMKAKGAPFSSPLLDSAYRGQIVSDTSRNSTKKTIKNIIDNNVDYEKKGFPRSLIPLISDAISKRVLPKFNSFLDRVNGMGVSVHDVYATRIDLLSLSVNDGRWSAKIQYTGQDHFGLDVTDIKNKKFSQFQFFKIWFVLQRYSRFAFRPFYTNMVATIDIKGGI